MAPFKMGDTDICQVQDSIFNPLRPDDAYM